MSAFNTTPSVIPPTKNNVHYPLPAVRLLAMQLLIPGMTVMVRFTALLALLAFLSGCRARERPVVAPVTPEEVERAMMGSRAGEERTVAGVKLCWCPAGKFMMGSPPDEPERRPGEDQVEVTLTRGFWMAKYETTQGEWKRVIGKLPGELTAELPEGDDYPVGNVNFAEAEDFCAKLTETGPESGRVAEGLGVPIADRGAVGIRLPRRDDDGHGVRRQDRQQAGEHQERAVQRRRGRAVAGQGREGRRLPGQCLGHSRHARQHLRVVPRLVPRQTARRNRSRPARREGHRAEEPDRRLFAEPPRELLARRRLAEPVGLSAALRAGAALRPHRLPRGARPKLTQRASE